jgi:hypothetical protein
MMMELLPILTSLLSQIGGLTGGEGLPGGLEGLPDDIDWDALPPDAAEQLRRLLEMAEQEGVGGMGGRRGGGRGGRNPGPPDGGPTPRIEPGGGSGPDGEYTLEDLMRLRDEYERQESGQGPRGNRGGRGGPGGRNDE